MALSGRVGTEPCQSSSRGDEQPGATAGGGEVPSRAMADVAVGELSVTRSVSAPAPSAAMGEGGGGRCSVAIHRAQELAVGWGPVPSPALG